MKFRNRIQLQALLIGFGAALLLASSTFAQEIENTRWDDGPGAVPVSQSTAVDDSNTASAVSNDIVPAAVITPSANQEASAFSLEQWVVPGVGLMISICFIAVYALTRTKRSYSNRDAHMGDPTSSPTLS